MLSKKQKDHIDKLAIINKNDSKRRERCKLIGKRNKGRKLTSEQKQTISNSLKLAHKEGRRNVWNKGIKYEVQKLKGHIPWNKGKSNVYNKDILKILSQKHIKYNIDIDNIKELYLNGKTCNDIAKIYKCSYSVIYRRLKPLDILRDYSKRAIGRKMSNETRIKMSNAQIMRYKNPIELEKISGKNNGFYGKKHKKESIERMKQKLSILFSGENNPQWLGGLSFEPYGIDFNKILKNEIRKRDHNKCQVCKISELNLNYKLIVHHIDYNKRNNKPDNLISLCRSCHMETNFNRKYWRQYFQTKEVMIAHDTK